MREDGEGETHLICPASEWDDWSLESEKVHGLTRDLLAREGIPVEEVARRMLDVLGMEDVRVTSDAARWEQQWLDRLMQAAGLQHSIRVLDLEREILLPEAQRILRDAPAEGAPGAHLAWAALLDRASDIVGGSRHAEQNLRRIRHRALQDAGGMRWWWLEVRERTAEALDEGYGSRLLARKGTVPRGVLGWD
ncbi:transcriptional regulator [Roseomonas indoligenes]|uniref:Transcriptional regulator n=1 Tax=Roseomonas indoligenes TaxID=2820811 RepID=A0A940S8D4_9PROT|nr:transcriptional regulator [Pararoseomonas indoligenes]MBP0495805.1 transcriptional regulator [Pararoseomonas indoligenes]